MSTVTTTKKVAKALQKSAILQSSSEKEALRSFLFDDFTLLGIDYTKYYSDYQNYPYPALPRLFEHLYVWTEHPIDNEVQHRKRNT